MPASLNQNFHGILIRISDVFWSVAGLILFSPVFLVIIAVIRTGSAGGAFYKQKRVGLNGKDFLLLKFRTMVTGADKSGELTVGSHDRRITSAGYFLRRFKLDELPQLVNVLKGDMSIVGPRPEVRKYTEMYTAQQRTVLTVRPGITDYASIEYFDENDLLARAKDPESAYIREVMPAKIELNLKYIGNRTIWHYYRIILLTLLRIFWSR